MEWYDAWYGSIRHWWQDAGDEPGMFHRVSGEKFVFRGDVRPEERTVPSSLLNIPQA
jgi:hypothetical protein